MTRTKIPATSIESGDTPDEKPTFLRSQGSADLADVPDNTPTPRVDVDVDKKLPAADPGYVYVKHPKNGALCLVDEKSLPELEVDGYQRA